MPGIGNLGVNSGIGVIGSGIDWAAYWATNLFGQDDLSFRTKSGTRNGLTLPDTINPGTGDAKIYPKSLRISINAYFKYVDGIEFDIGDYLTLGYRGGIHTDNAGAVQHIWGKGVWNGTLAGTYGFAYLTGTVSGRTYVANKISLVLQTSVGFFFANTGLGIGDNALVIGEIDNVAKKIRVFVDNTQVGTDVDFTGDITSPARHVMLGIGQKYNLTTYEKQANLDVGEAFIYKKILSSGEKNNILNGIHVGGTNAIHWITSNYQIAYDIASGGYDILRTITTGECTNSYLNKVGSPYMLNNGYSIYKRNLFPEIIVPSVNGVFRVTPYMLTNWIKYGEVDGNLIDVNAAPGAILYPSGIMDRSDTDLFTDACRSSSYYDVIRPTLWNIRELLGLFYREWIKVNNCYLNFGTDTDIKSITEMFSYNTDKSVLEDIYINLYLKQTKYRLNDLTKAMLADGGLDIFKYTCWKGKHILYTGSYYDTKLYVTWVAQNTVGEKLNSMICTFDDNDFSASQVAVEGTYNEANSHSWPGMVIDDSGYIYVARNVGDATSFVTVNKSTNINDITSFDLFETIETTEGHAYPKLFKMNGDIYLITRRIGGNISLYKKGVSSFVLNDIADLPLNKHYAWYLRNDDENKISVVLGAVDNVNSNWMISKIYYVESLDGITFKNMSGSFTKNIVTEGLITIAQLDTNCQVIVNTDVQAHYQATDGFVLNGVPYLLVEEGYQAEGEISELVDYSAVCVYYLVGGSWTRKEINVIDVPYQHKVVIGHQLYHLAYLNSKFYLYVFDRENYKYVKLYTSIDLNTWTDKGIILSEDLSSDRKIILGNTIHNKYDYGFSIIYQTDSGGDMIIIKYPTN